MRSHLEYASSVWSPYKIQLIKDLEKVQKRATKLIRSCSKLEYSARLKLLNLPTLRYRRARGDMIEVYKILTSKYDSVVCPPLQLSTSITRDHALKLQTNRCKYNVRKFNFCNRVVNMWNSLPEIVVLSSSINSFKIALDKFWCSDDKLYNPDYNFYPFDGTHMKYSNMKYSN